MVHASGKDWMDNRLEPMSSENQVVPVKIDRELDLTGEVCPYIFVKSKLVLEAMNEGEILRVIVDHMPATDSMPMSLEIEGHEVLSVGPAGEGLREIIVRCEKWV